MRLDDTNISPNPGYVRTHCAHIIQVAHRLTRKSPEYLVHICEDLLSNPPSQAHEMKRASGLNWNQFPIQYVVSQQKEEIHHKLIGDPAFYISDPLLRYEQSMKALPHVLKMGQAYALYDRCVDAIHATLPQTDTGLEEYTYGVMWLGVSLTRPGAAVYILSVLDTKTAWYQAHTAAQTLLSNSEEMHHILSSLAPVCRLASVGIEGSSLHDARLKLYWRMSSPTAFHDFIIPLYTDDNILHCIGTILKDYFFTLSALTFSVGIDLKTGKIADIKIDISNRILNLDIHKALSCIHKVADFLGFRTLISEKEFLSCSKNAVEVAFIGIGVDNTHRYRLHLYLY